MVTAGGFDPELQVAYNDVDFCLRLRSLGYWVIFTLFCTLTHYECATPIPHSPGSIGRRSKRGSDLAVMNRSSVRGRGSSRATAPPVLDLRQTLQ
jgi:GT2 family glycosyltransferase